MFLILCFCQYWIWWLLISDSTEQLPHKREHTLGSISGRSWRQVKEYCHILRQIAGLASITIQCGRNNWRNGPKNQNKNLIIFSSSSLPLSSHRQQMEDVLKVE